MSNVLLSSAYLGPVQYYSEMMNAQKVFIECYDSYQKQTYRNRCRVLAANGVADLTIPVVKVSGQKTLMKDVRIDYAMLWQNKHWRTIVSAYNSSPFFEYYQDDFQPFFEKKYDFLFDFNMELNEVIIDLLEVEAVCKPTDDFITDFDGIDLRQAISPKKGRGEDEFVAQEYTQTFGEKFPFQPNLSIVDLLFNVGPEACSYLVASL